MLATDAVYNKPIAGALVEGESKEEVTYFLTRLKEWLRKPLSLITIDFSSRIESGVKEVFSHVPVQKCAFHAVQLLTKAYLKELARIKRARLLSHIVEWRKARRASLDLEKGRVTKISSKWVFPDVKEAFDVYLALRNAFKEATPQRIERALLSFFSTSQFAAWKGRKSFLERYEKIFTKHKFSFSQKGPRYIGPKVYKAWRGAIRDVRTSLEAKKAAFNKAKYLVLANPVKMKPYQRTELRTCLKTFPWLRTYRKTLVKFYYQFRVPSKNRRSLKFLTSVISKDSHPRLKSAVHTLIDNEESIFRYQTFRDPETSQLPAKSIKVVNESVNKKLNNLYRTQCGMRTLQNLHMRISERLFCPVIVSPGLSAKVDKVSKI